MKDNWSRSRQMSPLLLFRHFEAKFSTIRKRAGTNQLELEPTTRIWACYHAMSLVLIQSSQI